MRGHSTVFCSYITATRLADTHGRRDDCLIRRSTVSGVDHSPTVLHVSAIHGY